MKTNTRLTLAQALCNGFNPDQARDEGGRWASGSGGTMKEKPEFQGSGGSRYRQQNEKAVALTEKAKLKTEAADGHPQPGSREHAAAHSSAAQAHQAAGLAHFTAATSTGAGANPKGPNAALYHYHLNEAERHLNLAERHDNSSARWQADKQRKGGGKANCSLAQVLVTAAANGFNPDQARDEGGRWASGSEAASETEGPDKTQRALDLTRHARTSGRSADVLRARQAHESALAEHRAKAIDATTEVDRHHHQVLADVHARVLQGFAVKDGQHSYDPARVPLDQGQPGGVAALHAGTAARLHDEAMVADTKLSGTRLHGSEARAQEHEKVAAALVLVRWA